MEVVFPRLAPLTIGGEPAATTLVTPDFTGKFLLDPARQGEINHKYPGSGAFPWMDLFTEKEGLYLGAHDTFLAKTLLSSKGALDQRSVELSMTKQHRIRAMSTRTYSYAVGVHTGDWHAAARIYQEFFYAHYPVNRYTPWLREADNWIFGSAVGNQANRADARYEDLTEDFKDAAFHGVSYLQEWGSTFNGACPTYYVPRKERGGEDVFTSMIKEWRDGGGSIGFYFHGNSAGAYYTLSDRYFETPWSEYPAAQRPPSWEWYVSNMDYASEGSVVDKEKWMEATRAVNEKIGKKLPVGNEQIEEIDGYHNFSWHTRAFPEFLYNAIHDYVAKYGCNTAYLDTFAFQNSVPDFNPFLKHHGESDKAMYKMAWLSNYMKEMREIDPSFNSVEEGAVDVFGTHLCHLMSSDAKRDHNIFRYTFPDQVLFLGNCNGQWTKPLSKQALSEAFLYGMKYDFIPSFFSHSYYILRLRQRISPFLNCAVFDDVVGLSVSDPGIRAYAHLIKEGSSRFIEHSGSKTVTITLLNKLAKNGRISYALPKGFTLKSAFMCELCRDPVPLTYEKKGNVVSFAAPKAESAAVVLIDTVKDALEWTAIPRQIANDVVEVSVFNFNSKEISLTFAASAKKTTFTNPKQTLRVPAGAMRTVVFRDANPSGEFRMANVTVSSGTYAKTYLISLGKTGREIPLPLSFTDKYRLPQREYVFDFEGGGERTVEGGTNGSRCVELRGNGEQKMDVINLPLMPETEYAISLMLKKDSGADAGYLGVHNNGPEVYVGDNVVNHIKLRDDRIEEYGAFGKNVPADGAWHEVQGNFRTTKTLKNATINIYNNGSTKSLWYDDIKITIRSDKPLPQ
jgi:hypothetical protein